MRRLRYSVAMSLDGFIAERDGGYDWIVMDPDIDFASITAEFDTLLMGRGTFAVAGSGSGPGMDGMQVYVVSTTLDPKAHPDVTILADDVAARVRALKEQDGKDIWLFGGGVLFRSLLDWRLVDTVEVAVIPVLLGDGIPLVPEGEHAKLRLQKVDQLPKTGTVMLAYDVDYDV